MAGKPVNQKVTLQLALSIYNNDEPMAELRRNQRGEIGHEHVKAHYAAASGPCLLSSKHGTSRIDHDTGACVPYSLRTMSQVLLRPLPTDV